MPPIIKAAAFATLGLGGCSQPWPVEEVQRAEKLLKDGPQRLQCWDSSWMKRNKVRNYPFFSDSDACKRNMKVVHTQHDDKIVTAIGRCSIGNVQAEYRVSLFSSKERMKYYGGYYCTKAHGENIFRHRPGSLTDAEGAM